MERKKILIVDDEENFTRLVKTTLEERGNYDVRVENEGKKAFPVARAFRPDLILLDIVMPGMEGSYVAEQIKKDDTVKNTPIVFLTATVTEKETDESCGIMGGYPFLAKPVSIRKLIDCVEKYANK